MATGRALKFHREKDKSQKTQRDSNNLDKRKEIPFDIKHV